MTSASASRLSISIRDEDGSSWRKNANDDGAIEK
jgi:hypothetical protein